MLIVSVVRTGTLMFFDTRLGNLGEFKRALAVFRKERIMFDRFTDRARRVIVLAKDEAGLLGHNYIGTEHILLGLIQEGEGVGAETLKSLRISLEEVRARVEEVIGRGQHNPVGHIPFTPRAREVFECAMREALKLNHPYIGTEHILLGLIREGKGVAAQVLGTLGVTSDIARQAVFALLSGVAPEPEPEPHKKPSFEFGVRKRMDDGSVMAVGAVTRAGWKIVRSEFVVQGPDDSTQTYTYDTGT